MASLYEETRKLIYKEIFEKLERKDDGRYRFAPRGTVKTLFQRDNHSLLRQLFRSLVSTGQIVSNGVVLVEDGFVTRVEARKLSNFWGTLVFASCSIDAAVAALRRLVAVDAWPVFDVEEKKLGPLPLSRAQLNDLFGDHVEADRFFSNQACFCAVVLRNREEVIVQDASCQRLPYLEEDCLGEGSFGKVYRVKVAKNHFFDAYAEAAKAYNGKPQYMARKDYIIADVNRAREEYTIMKKILSANFQKREHNIVQSWGCLQIESSYSLFMPVAICDLHTYMMVQHRNAPQELKNKADIIYSAAGLASGLQYLHGGMQTEELEELVCYHMDLNPSNVLIFYENNRNVWKLSDFGMARVKTRSGQLSSYRENDFNSLFVRRKKLQDPSLPSTLNRRGEGTWLPPESIAAVPIMKTGADVWALGCVLSVVFAYLGGGASGVDDYADARQNHHRADGSDRFFLRAAHFKSSKVHPEIKSRHEKLISEAAHRHIEERRACSHMLTFLQESVLKVDQAAKTETNAHKSPFSVKIASQRFSSSEDFKGLVISPNANSLAYCTNGKIVLYTSESLSVTEGHASTPPSEWNLTDTECFLQSLCLTKRYLVASTMGKNSLYIFDLEGGRQVDLNLTSMYRISLDVPTITNIAISPNSKTLVFVMKNETNMRGPGTLVYASLPGMIAFIRQELSYISESSDSHSHDAVRISRSHGLLRNAIELDWPAADIEHLSVSDTEDAYVVVRPRLTARTREHKIPVAHIWMDNSSVPPCPTVDTLNIVSLGFDGSSTAGFFTTFCVVKDRSSCALVTRARHTTLPNREAFQQQSHGLSPALMVRELVKIPGLVLGDDVVAVAVDSSDKTLIIVASLTGASRRVIHKISVPKHGQS
ncbi:hypothetical protein LMH87_007175 [Akanthomyces muscarius]|uniref:Protein kinase domain-containing protein n=1 Tax=Akanthomyces muscarius TaxID=2231603 RepID=A0A9W8QRQ4_AKAMU|nr:hypothetical protein LMH87_007175 [Akanthomyces muscarius]KAJ4165546.1 hypothetical protein LMH87_007175 [Akanthomyces muscarius]